MKISQLFQLNKSQAELDFVDINTEEDLPLFIDPFFLGKRKDIWSIEATRTLKSFFQKIIDLIRGGNIDEAKRLFQHLGEPNANCLGLSKGNPHGKGVSTTDTNMIFQNLIQSRAIETGLVQDVEDNILFVEKFGKDKLSDMTTNIINLKLIEYTQNQCALHNIPLVNIPTGYYWDIRTRSWENGYSEMLVVAEKKILLVPKGIVSFNKIYTPERYYNFFVLNFMQNEQLRLPDSEFVQVRRKSRVRYVTKKRLKAAFPPTKSFLRRFTIEHPEVLDDFRANTNINPLSNYEITSISITAISHRLIDQLQGIASGNLSASEYHNKIIGILELLFFPNLMSPIKENEIHDGRKRIDITYENSATSGIFWRLHEIHHIPCPYIFVECKNYSRDIVNPELDQISGRFSFNRGRVGFIVCRQIDNLDLFIQRCRDTYNDGRGLVIPLVDEDLIALLQNCSDFNSDFTEEFLATRVRRIIVG